MWTLGCVRRASPEVGGGERLRLGVMRAAAAVGTSLSKTGWRDAARRFASARSVLFALGPLQANTFAGTPPERGSASTAVSGGGPLRQWRRWQGWVWEVVAGQRLTSEPEQTFCATLCNCGYSARRFRRSTVSLNRSVAFSARGPEEPGEPAVIPALPHCAGIALLKPSLAPGHAALPRLATPASMDSQGLE